MPSFIIVGYLWQILGKGGKKLPPISEQPQKMSILNRVKVVLKALELQKMSNKLRKVLGQVETKKLFSETITHKIFKRNSRETSISISQESLASSDKIYIFRGRLIHLVKILRSYEISLIFPNFLKPEVLRRSAALCCNLHIPVYDQ